MTTIADAAWLATALLHRENVHAGDFSVQDIIQKATREKLVDRFRPGLQVHVSKHCVANKSPNPTPYRMLFETARGRRRLFKNGDPFHADRQDGKIRPHKEDLPPQYQQLVDWYDAVYSKQTPPPTPASTGVNVEPTLPYEGGFAKSPLATLVEMMQPGTAFVSSTGAVVIPNDLRKELGIEEGTRLSIYREQGHLILQPITDEFIHSLIGCLKGEDSLVEAREREHRIEKDRTAR